MKSPFSIPRNIQEKASSAVHLPAKINSLLHIPLYSNAVYLMLANITNSLLGFVFWIIAARLYTTETVGVASAIISSAALLEMISVMGFNYGLIRYIKSSEKPVVLINSSFTLTGLLSLVVAGIFIIGIGAWSPHLDIIRENPVYMIAFLFYVPILVLDDLTDTVMIGERRAGFTFIHSIIFNILRIVLLILLMFYSQSFGIFGSWSVSTFIALLIALLLLLPRAQPSYHFYLRVNKKAVSEILRFSFLSYLGDLFWNVPNLILPIIVVNLIGAVGNAFFFMAWSISSTLTIILQAIAMSLLTEGTYDEAKLRNHVRRSIKMLVLLLVPAAAVIWLLANKILEFYGDLYAKNGTTLLHWLIIAAFPLAINTIYFSVKRVQKDMRPIILLSVFMAGNVVLAAYLLLPRLGINGIGIAWLAGQTITAFYDNSMGYETLDIKILRANVL